MEQTWYWIGVVGMAFGALLFGLNTRRQTDEYSHLSSVTLFFVPLIAFALYLAQAFGQGISEIDGRKVSWIKYVTWFTTTPLLLNQLCRLVRAPTSLIVSLLFADMFMIATGGVAELSPKPISYVWYAVSTGAFLAILVLLYADLSRKARDEPPRTQRLFRILRDVTAATWIAYPLVWLFGTAGLSLYGSGVQTMLYTILDLSSKVGFGLIILVNRDAVQQLGQEVAQQRHANREGVAA